MSTSKTSSYTKIALYILGIITALATAFYTLVDGDPNTNPNLPGTAATISENVSGIKTEVDNLKADTKAVSTESTPAPEVVK